jgi:sugar lactone lactonase YvrE
MRWLTRALVVLIGFLAATVLAVRVWFGGGARLEDRTTAPLVPSSAIETVVALDYPPGNIAVSRTGRVFFTLHPDGRPPEQVMELVDGKARPFAHGPAPEFQSILSLRIDRQDRLWLLDYARYGRGQPRLLAFDLASGQLVHHYEFPENVAGFLSMLNDFQVDPKGEKIYIAESSPIRQRPALVVYDVQTQSSRRLLERHPSVLPGDFILQTPGRDMIVLGIFTLRIGVDSIALDTRGEWLYYGPVNGDRLYRIATRDLNDASLADAALGLRVEDFGPKTLSDGLSMDVEDDVYITDPEHSAVLRIGRDRTLATVAKDPRLRWPDGLGFGPDGWLYVTCSALHYVLFTTTADMRAHAPFHIYRLKPGPVGVPGH